MELEEGRVWKLGYVIECVRHGQRRSFEKTNVRYGNLQFIIWVTGESQEKFSVGEPCAMLTIIC